MLINLTYKCVSLQFIKYHCNSEYHFVLYLFFTQICFDSLSVPLKMLGCFSKEVEELRSTTVHLSTLKGTHPLEHEFRPLTPPTNELYQDSFIYCAAEIFRYLRDMSLGIPLSQSKPLLKSGSSDRKRLLTPPTVDSSTTPLLKHNFDGQPKKFFSGHLLHPGAVLCMLDLLPAVEYDSIVSNRVPTSPVVATSDSGSDSKDMNKFNIEKGREVQFCVVL